MEMREISFQQLMQLLAESTKQEPDTADWVQVAALKPEDIVRKKMMRREATALAREFDILKKKMDMLHAQHEVAAAEWWAHLHQAYSLPKNIYTITEDNRILMQPGKADLDTDH